MLTSPFPSSGQSFGVLFSPGQHPAVDNVPELCSDHEEADTRMLLHAAHAHHDTVVIKSPDTDVALLCLSHCTKMTCQRLCFATGVRSKQRLLDITAMRGKLSDKLCNVLPQIHSLTGCDSTSGFFGKGKKKLYSLVKTNEEYLDKIASSLGQTFTPDIPKTVAAIKPLICQLYSITSNSINEARYKLFCCNASNERQLPPTKDALKQHLLRVNYQATIWQMAMCPLIKALSPHGSGWIVQDNRLEIKWMENPTAPASVFQTVHCKCQKSSLPKCQP